MARRIKIVLLGSGNVATHIAGGFQAAGCHICAVYSRDISHAARLADTLAYCKPIDSPALVPVDADLYIIASSDSAVAAIASAMPDVKGIVVHTSGSVPIETLAAASSRHGVLYPLQTFSRESDVDLRRVPIFTEASDEKTLCDIDRYAAMISDHVHHADSRRRTTLHIAGVISCNFVNYLWQLTQETLASDGYTLDVVQPLVEATMKKAFEIGPYAAQTGPAARGDKETIKKHLALLPPHAAEIYRQLSDAISNAHNRQ